MRTGGADRRVELPPVLADMLRRLQEAEAAAAGAQRRVAYGRTRAVLGAARAGGVSAQQLAECLGVTAGSLRGRAVPTGGTLSGELVERLTALTPAELGRRSATTLAPAPGGCDYRIDDVVRAVLALPCVDSPPRALTQPACGIDDHVR